MNRPTVIIYGGTIQAGVRHVDCPALGFKKGEPVNIGEAFESYGIVLTGPHTVGYNIKLTERRCLRHRKDFRRGTFGCYPSRLPRVRCLRWYVHVRSVPGSFRQCIRDA